MAVGKILTATSWQQPPPPGYVCVASINCGYKIADIINCGIKIVRPGEQTPFPPGFGMTAQHPQQALYQTVRYAVFVILVVVVDVDAVFFIDITIAKLIHLF